MKNGARIASIVFIILWAFTLVVSIGMIVVLNTALNNSEQFAEIMRQIRENNPDMTEEQVRQVLQTLVTVGIVLLVITLVGIASLIFEILSLGRENKTLVIVASILCLLFGGIIPGILGLVASSEMSSAK